MPKVSYLYDEKYKNYKKTPVEVALSFHEVNFDLANLQVTIQYAVKFNYDQKIKFDEDQKVIKKENLPIY